ncbi:MAG: hypothetical protein WB402_07100 [Sulfuricaulis sp.]|uniref:AraC family transcriptional regulator n=1 Tax=Sulfuricaulis sp. TaxID=2003553 RepID=UPI003C4DD545
MKDRITIHALKWLQEVFVLLLLGLLVSLPSVANAAETTEKPQASQYKGMDQKAQSLKKEVMELNRDLLALEEELLFPASTQVAVFVSMDIGSLFELDAVEVKLDDKVVSHYLYTQREIEALRRGGVQRLYLGNLRVGKHELVAFFTGKGPHGRDYRRGATLEFEKQTEPRYIELQISDVTRNLQPEFRVKEWQ